METWRTCLNYYIYFLSITIKFHNWFGHAIIKLRLLHWFENYWQNFSHKQQSRQKKKIYTIFVSSKNKNKLKSMEQHAELRFWFLLNSCCVFNFLLFTSDGAYSLMAIPNGSLRSLPWQFHLLSECL